MPLSLNTVLKQLELEDQFIVFPVCESWHYIFPPNIPNNLLCSHRQTPLFQPVSQLVFQRLSERKGPAPSLITLAPIQPLSNLLIDFLTWPEIELEVRVWQSCI